MVKRALLAAVALVLLASPPALASKPGGSGTSAPLGVGLDVSYPQCPFTTPPATPAFAIIGVNSGLSSQVNPCLGLEYTWGAASAGAGAQPAASMYLNTGNPGDVLKRYGITTWPHASLPKDPYGSCHGAATNNAACAWQYGYNTARADELYAGVQASFLTPQTYWLDVETVNSWSNTTSYNQADLEGMVAELKASGSKVGLYSTSPMWSRIIGTTPPASSLYALPEWQPGATTLAAAQANCTALTPLTAGGKITLAQYTSGLDFDVSCP